MLKKFNKPKTPHRIKKRKKITYKDYSRMCKFTFDVEKYPKEFELNLIDDYGWYLNKNNPNGVSRDHMLSISYGWKKDISPKIIGHPANCQLMLFEDNHEKAWKSSIELSELIYRIEAWDKKYK